MKLVKVPKSIERSLYRKELDDMLAEGEMSYSKIEAWFREHGEAVSRQAVSKYHKFCFNVNAKAVELYEEEKNSSEDRLIEAAKKEVNALKLYDKIISEAMNVATGAVDPARLIDLALKASKQRQEHIEAVGDLHEEERIQILKDIRELLLNRELRKAIAGVKSRRTFDDPTLN